MSKNNTESVINIVDCSNTVDENIACMFQRDMMDIAGKKLEDRINEEVEDFTQQVTMVNNSASISQMSDLTEESRQQTSFLRQHYLQISAQGFKSKIQEEVKAYTTYVSSIGQEETSFNERSKLLLQCHTMSAYITNTLMEKIQKNSNPPGADGHQGIVGVSAKVSKNCPTKNKE